MTVEAEIYSRLSSDSGIVTLLGSPPPVYSGELPQGLGGPGIFFFRVSTIERVSCMGVDGGVVRARYQVGCVAEVLEDARSMAETVRKALQRYRTTSGTIIQDIFVRTSHETYSSAEKLHQVDYDYEVIYVEDLPS